MNDPAPPSDVPAPLNLSVEGPSGAEGVELVNLSMEASPRADGVDLARRVQRLEDTVAVLKDTAAMEQRVVDRVTERLASTRHADKITATPVSSLPPRYEEAPGQPSRGTYAWLFFDMAADARLMIIMLFDSRYILAWTTHLVVWLFIPAILTSGWWFPLAYIPFLGSYLDKALDLLLAFGVYKALSRETRRYREMLDHRR